MKTIRPVFISFENAKKLEKKEIVIDDEERESNLLFWAYNFYSDVIHSASTGNCTCEISYLGKNESFDRFLNEFDGDDLADFFPGIKIKVDKEQKFVSFDWSNKNK